MKKILIIEDDKKIAAALEVRLRGAGYEVTAVCDGLKGLASAVQIRPDLIISDVWLPGAVGFLVAERLKNVGCGGVPVIFMTASKKKDLWKLAQEAGAEGFFEKPYDAEKLLKAISAALNKAPMLEEESARTGLVTDWPDTPPNNGKRKREKIGLIIEDDPKIAASLEIRFKANGYSACVANDALQGTRLAVKNRPDLIILDISLPAGNGLGVAANLKKLPETSNVPIIFVTASKDPRLREKMMDIHAAGLFEKPYDIEELLALAQHTLEQLDLSQQHSGRPEKSFASQTKTRAERILIVEDDNKLAMALGLRLKGAGYQTMLAQDALAGLSIAVRTPPDLVLLDVSMPAGNGLDLAEKIGKLLPQPPPVIFLTAGKQPHLRQKAEELGAMGFFEKPYEAEELMAAIEQALAKPQPTKFK